MQPHFSDDPSDNIRKTHFIAWYVRWKLLKTNQSSSYFKLLFFNATMLFLVRKMGSSVFFLKNNYNNKSKSQIDVLNCDH